MARQTLTEEVEKLWSGWEIRVLVLLSLSLQIILVIFGSQRKHTRIIWINLLVWLAYLTADKVATVALGCLARSRGDNFPQIQAFWAPFLLLHLGGPDTITAYSLKDNELWLRHFLEFVVQVAVAFYVFIPSWNKKDAFRFIAIPMFITGIIKYGERTLVLWSSSAKQFKDSLRSPPEFDQDFSSKKKEEEVQLPKESTEVVTDNYLVEAVSLFKKFRCLYADLILDHYERNESFTILESKSAKEAFKLVAVELGFMYDVLYTKTTTIYSGFGIFLRCICFFSHVSVSIVFLIIIDKEPYSPIDISITYVLLLGAVFLEVYAFITFLLSDRTKFWLSNSNLISVDTCSTGLLSNDSRRWSGSMGQYNLLSFCLDEYKSTTFIITGVQKLFGIRELVEQYKYLSWKEVNDGLQEMIFKQVLENSKKIKGDAFDIKLCKELLAQRGDHVLSCQRSYIDQFRCSTIEVEFDQSLLIWHIATDLCYYDDFGAQKNDKALSLGCEISKCVSDYMLYLLIICPTMLPKGIGELRYKDTCVEAMRYFYQKKFGSSTNIREACKDLLRPKVSDRDKNTKKVSDLDKDTKNITSLSVLSDGCKLAEQLKKLNYTDKWKIISEVWVEMLVYAANHCGWKEHGEQLVNGGELLTHVCLLMAHLGLSEQYQIQKQPIHQHWSTKLFGGLKSWIRDRVLSICYDTSYRGGYYYKCGIIPWNPLVPRPGYDEFLKKGWLPNSNSSRRKRYCCC